MSDKKPLCMIPWVHLHTWPNGNVYPCCITPMEHIAGNLNDNTLEEVFNSDLMKNLRVDMMNGVKSESCERCWKQEENGGHSMRMRANDSWKHLVDDSLSRTDADGSVEEMKLPYWDFRFSNICNFKCRSCGPQLSTGWYPDTKKIAVIETGRSFLPDDVPKKQHYDLWEQIEPHFEYVEEIYFAGGEPLIMEEHYRILKKLDEMGRHDVKLRYNTNFSEMRYKDLHVLDFWPKFKHIEVGASIDGMRDEGEYIRSGFKWEQFVSNREEMKKKCPHVYFYITCTTSIQNAYHVVPFHLALFDEGLIDNLDKFFCNILQEPPKLDINILPDHHKEVLKTVYENHVEYLKKHKAPNAARGFSSLISQLMRPCDKSDEYLNQFGYFTRTLDSVRDENWCETFPQMKDLIRWEIPEGG